jgi:predicted acyltransferase
VTASRHPLRAPGSRRPDDPAVAPSHGAQASGGVRAPAPPAEKRVAAAQPDAAHHPREERNVAGARRLFSVDATRGWAITIMLVVMHPFPRQHQPEHLTHPDWYGLHFVDLFFPLFLFVMGVSMSFSQRAAEPQRVLRRVVLLLVLGIVLSSLRHERLFITGVLQHIALSYLLAWLVLRAPRQAQLPAAAAILAVVWIGFVLWAVDGQDPWGPEGTLAHAVDGWLIGGFATEGVMPTVTSTVNVVGGALIGRRLKERPTPQEQWRWLAAQAVWLIAAALALTLAIPIAKRVWTPSFAMLTLGTSCVWLAFFVWLVDLHGIRRWTTALRELGANPIAVYSIFMALIALLDDLRPLMPALTPFDNPTAGSMLYSAVWLFFGWLFAHALYRRGLFFKI